MLGVLKLKCYYLMLPLQQLFDWFILLKAFFKRITNGSICGNQRLHIFEKTSKTNLLFYGRHRIYQYNEDIVYINTMKTSYISIQ